VLPLGEHNGEVVQEAVELHLQIIEDVGGLDVQLQGEPRQQVFKKTIYT